MTRQEAIARLNKMFVNCDTNRCSHVCKYCDEALNMAIKALEHEPVKHGEWIQAKDIEKEYAVCTNCKHHGEFYMDYCPNCGSYNGGEKHEV